jgi:hypothetical protein
MADTSFTAQVTTILATWLNAINNFVYRGINPVYATTTGTANAQVLTITGANAAFTSLTGGESFTFKAGALLTNTGAMTLQIVAGASIAAKSVKTPSGGDPGAGAVTAGGIYTVVYEASADVLVLLGGDNPPITLPVPVASGGTGSTTAAAARSALSAQVDTLPTRQVFLSGTAATYTTPAGARQLRIRMKGAGGGGGGSSDGTNGGNGGAGGNTIFNSIEAAGGAGGACTTTGNTGGAAGGTGGTGTASLRIAGGAGTSATTPYGNATNAVGIGGCGGGTGGGKSNASAAGSNAVANSGGGGGGASSGASYAFASMSTTKNGAGGGEGEYAELIINTPAASYTYTIGAAGAAGTAGTSGFVGGAGGTGFIVVDEYY